MPSINIIGCGVSGLSTALVLLEKGHQVRIITAALPAQTTSAVAAAIWFPYAAAPKDKVGSWSRISFDVYEKLAAESEQTGVSMVTLTTLIEDEAEAWWKNALPESHLCPTPMEAIPAGYKLGYDLIVPLIETPIYLDYLLRQVQAKGAAIMHKKLDSLAAGLAEADYLVNCTGLAAAELLGDSEMYPIQGQIIKIPPQSGIRCILSDTPRGPEPEQPAYVVPRRDGIILGGTARQYETGLTPDPQESQRILARCLTLEPALGAPDLEKALVGLRPGRTSIRLEKAGNIIHNYGHGGAGFTVSWGCAYEVARLLGQY
ncbi:MAG TPA: FAD-dependent oxidoreductase [Saprospiraceae bacterium]|nr:FAD-dependent oxidoreductase [Saprospiraceae bacterium]HMQ85419.1 FAD-dependent oxidoreductase [Saprospiraceae bacterium]